MTNRQVQMKPALVVRTYPERLKSRPTAALDRDRFYGSICHRRPIRGNDYAIQRAHRV